MERMMTVTGDTTLSTRHRFLQRLTYIEHLMVDPAGSLRVLMVNVKYTLQELHPRGYEISKTQVSIIRIQALEFHLQNSIIRHPNRSSSEQG